MQCHQFTVDIVTAGLSGREDKVSFFIGIFNMLPLMILDGEKYIMNMVEGKVSKPVFNATRIGINILGFGLLGANIIATVIRSGFVTI